VAFEVATTICGEKNPMPVVIEWLYRCVGGFDNGSAAILI